MSYYGTIETFNLELIVDSVSMVLLHALSKSPRNWNSFLRNVIIVSVRSDADTDESDALACRPSVLILFEPGLIDPQNTWKGHTRS